jgi:hypothetical protein
MSSIFRSSQTRQEITDPTMAPTGTNKEKQGNRITVNILSLKTESLATPDESFRENKWVFGGHFY